MNKKWLIIGAFLVLLSVGSSFYIILQIKSAQNSLTSRTTPESVDPSVNLLTWDDPAGFTFEYPEDLAIDKHDEDQENYAHVELTHPAHQGKIIVWVKDLPLNSNGIVVADSGEWVENEEEFANSNVLDTQLGNQPAKKVLLSAPLEKLITGTVYDDVLWYIEGILTDTDYWTSVYQSIISSFTFKPLEGDNVSGETGIVEEYVDEEEVIE